MNNNAFRNILLILVSILSAVMLYFMFNVRSDIKAARELVQKVQVEIATAQDSISSARNSIQTVLHKLDFAAKELGILQNERKLLELERERKRAANWEELQRIKSEIKTVKDKMDRLQKEAEQFEL